VELFNFFRLMLAVVITVSLIWPINIPLMALAYRVRQGQTAIPFEKSAFWWRSTFAALGLAGMGLVLVVVDYLLASGAGFPAGPLHLILVMGYLPIAVWFLFVLFALEDMLQALAVLFLYIFLPGLPLLFIDRVLQFWRPLQPALSWLLVPTP
jgi:hypothetical protein